MAREAAVTLTPDSWTKITDGSVTTDVSVELQDGAAILRATASDTEPTGEGGLRLLYDGNGWSESTIAEKFPGAGIDTAAYLWGKALYGDSAIVYVSHA